MNKYEVGYDDEMIGIYYAESAEEAREECCDDMASVFNDFKPDTPARERINGLIARKVDY